MVVVGGRFVENCFSKLVCWCSKGLIRHGFKKFIIEIISTSRLKEVKPHEKNYGNTFTILALFYFILFCQTFENLFILCVEFLIKSKVQLSSFEP
jgi:hypothetical protein